MGLLTTEVRAVTLTLATNSIVIPSEGQTFQMPLSGSDPDGQPLTFSAKTNAKQLRTTFAPRSNRSVVMNVSGVDANTNAFTGDIQMQLFEDLTPMTAERFINRTSTNFYDGLIFHRVIKGFVAQGGGATNDFNFNDGTVFDDEFTNTLTYCGFGQLGEANSGTPNTDVSQFFFTDVDQSLENPNDAPPVSLNFVNPIFGQLTSGFDIMRKILSTPVGVNFETGEQSLPISNVVINTAIIITNSQDGVMRLTAVSNFVGNAKVTISAMNAEGQVATQTLSVVVVPRRFLHPFPV